TNTDSFTFSKFKPLQPNL
nr:lectin fraction II 33 kda polypeptide {N-terminal} [Butea frondosa, seeds, Peptide Partial, 18 aa] [Butea monosperma]